MKVQWYIRTDLGSKSELRGVTEGESPVEVLRAVLAEHGPSLRGRPFAGICMHAMPAESECSCDKPKGGAVV